MAILLNLKKSLDIGAVNRCNQQWCYLDFCLKNTRKEVRVVWTCNEKRRVMHVDKRVMVKDVQEKRNEDIINLNMS